MRDEIQLEAHASCQLPHIWRGMGPTGYQSIWQVCPEGKARPEAFLAWHIAVYDNPCADSWIRKNSGMSRRETSTRSSSSSKQYYSSVVAAAPKQQKATTTPQQHINKYNNNWYPLLLILLLLQRQILRLLLLFVRVLFFATLYSASVWVSSLPGKTYTSNEKTELVSESGNFEPVANSFGALGNWSLSLRLKPWRIWGVSVARGLGDSSDFRNQDLHSLNRGCFAYPFLWHWWCRPKSCSEQASPAERFVPLCHAACTWLLATARQEVGFNACLASWWKAHGDSAERETAQAFVTIFSCSKSATRCRMWLSVDDDCSSKYAQNGKNAGQRMFIDDNEGLQAISIEQSGLDSKMRQHVRACCIQLQSEDFINQGKRTSFGPLPPAATRRLH